MSAELTPTELVRDGAAAIRPPPFSPGVLKGLRLPDLARAARGLASGCWEGAASGRCAGVLAGECPGSALRQQPRRKSAEATEAGRTERAGCGDVSASPAAGSSGSGHTGSAADPSAASSCPSAARTVV